MPPRGSALSPRPTSRAKPGMSGEKRATRRIPGGGTWAGADHFPVDHAAGRLFDLPHHDPLHRVPAMTVTVHVPSDSLRQRRRGCRRTWRGRNDPERGCRRRICAIRPSPAGPSPPRAAEESSPRDGRQRDRPADAGRRRRRNPAPQLDLRVRRRPLLRCLGQGKDSSSGEAISAAEYDCSATSAASAAPSASIASGSTSPIAAASRPTVESMPISSCWASSAPSSNTGMRNREPHSGHRRAAPGGSPGRASGARWGREIRSAVLWPPPVGRVRGSAQVRIAHFRLGVCRNQRRRPARPPRCWERRISRRSAGISPFAPTGPPDNGFDARSGREIRSHSPRLDKLGSPLWTDTTTSRPRRGCKPILLILPYTCGRNNHQRGLS